MPRNVGPPMQVPGTMAQQKAQSGHLKHVCPGIPGSSQAIPNEIGHDLLPNLLEMSCLPHASQTFLQIQSASVLNSLQCNPTQSV